MPPIHPPPACSTAWSSRAPSPRAGSPASTTPRRARCLAWWTSSRTKTGRTCAWLDRSYNDEVAPPGSPFRPLYDDKIVFSGQPVALVVAETLEAARHARALVVVEYEREPHDTDLRRSRAPRPRAAAKAPASRRRPSRAVTPKQAFAAAAGEVDARVPPPVEHHNPMEMHAATVVCDGDGRSPSTTRRRARRTCSYLCRVFGLPRTNVRCSTLSSAALSARGCGRSTSVFLAVMAAPELERSVRVVLTRQQMFTFGHRPETIQRSRSAPAPTARCRPS